MFKYVNNNVKAFFKLSTISITSILLINVYKSKHNTITIDLNEITLTKQTLPTKDNPFELIEGFNLQEYEYKRISTSLYNPPLTSKLFPKSNLYGHELIRYFDF